MEATFNKLTKTTCHMAPFQNTEQHSVPTLPDIEVFIEF